MSDLKKRATMLIGGLQIQNKRNRGIGTLATIVYDNSTGAPLGLSNYHILSGKIGSSVIQPANKPRNDLYVVGNILRKGSGKWNTDYAIFEVNMANRENNTNQSLFGLEGVISEIVEPTVGMQVQKVGQYTGHTYGIVSKIDKENQVFKISPNIDKPALNQISRGGDSGALWVTDEVNFKAVGLHISGESQPKWYRRRQPDSATAINIKKVLKDLDVRF